MRHLIDLNDYPVEEWDKIINLAQHIMEAPGVYKGACTGKIMATLFYEPSTRTQMSFQSAMLRLGGGIIGFDNPKTSSVSKGENLKDTTKTISGYSDIIVMRHNLEGAAKAAALTADCSIVNAGDGEHLHPTQTLTDLLTLAEEKKRLTDLNIGICGDLKYGRTVHSLVRAISRYKGNRLTFISSEELGMPDYIKQELSCNSDVKFEELSTLEEAISELDVLYMTRIQRERFTDEAQYEKQRQIYMLNLNKLTTAKRDLTIMHPLPRVDEIAVEVDDDPRAVYFKQANYGMYVRMALILTILQKDSAGDCVKPLLVGSSVGAVNAVNAVKTCCNEKCITFHEPILRQSFVEINGVKVCEYCEKRS